MDKRKYDDGGQKWNTPSILFVLLLFLDQFVCSISSIGGATLNNHQQHRTEIACEGDILNITCSLNYFVNIIRANYGRFSLLECNDRGETWENVECMYPKSTRVMQERCQFKRSCHVPANDLTFGDRCPETSKYLEATYQCRSDIERSQSGAPVTGSGFSTTYSSSSSEYSNPVTQRAKTNPAPSSAQFCPETSRRGMRWPSTKFNNSARISCPNNDDDRLYAEWQCSMNGSWKTPFPDLSRCASPWVRELVVTTTAQDQAPMNVTTIADHLRSKTSPTADGAVAAGELFGGDVAGIVHILTVLSSRGKLSEGEQHGLAEAFAEIGNNLAQDRTKAAWMEIPSTKRQAVADEMLAAMEAAVVAIAAANWTNSSSGFYYATSKIGFEILEPQPSDQEYFHLPTRISQPHANDNVKLPSSILHYCSSSDDDDCTNLIRTRLIFVHWNKIFGEYLSSSTPSADVESSDDDNDNQSNYYYSGSGTTSNLITVTILRVSADHHQVTKLESALSPSSPIVITFGKMLRQEGRVDKNNVSSRSVCVYWDDTRKEWSPEGCWKEGENMTHLICACNHLTTFAVLMDVNGIVHEVQHQLALTFITYLGCVASIACCAMAIAAFCLFRSPIHPDRTTIHANLCLCLLLAELVFVLGIDQTDQTYLCTAVAAMLHYLFLCAFAWMLLEGVQLYVLLVQVFQAGYSRKGYFYALGYGAPLVIVGISLLVDSGAYGTSRHCWLKTGDYFLYCFVIPVAIVLLANLVFLIMALVVLCRHISYARAYRPPDDKQRRSSVVDNAGLWIRAALIMVVLLGLTWALGFFYILNPTPAFAYAFTVFNSSQGAFIFILHVLMNQQIRKDLQDRFAKFFDQSNTCHWRCSMGWWWWWLRTQTSSTDSQKTSQITKRSDDLRYDGDQCKDIGCCERRLGIGKWRHNHGHTFSADMPLVVPSSTTSSSNSSSSSRGSTTSKTECNAGRAQSFSFSLAASSEIR